MAKEAASRLPREGPKGSKEAGSRMRDCSQRTPNFFKLRRRCGTSSAPPAADPDSGCDWPFSCFLARMKTATDLLEPEPHHQQNAEGSPRGSWKWALPEVPREKRPASRIDIPVPFPLAPGPWPRGQFRILSG